MCPPPQFSHFRFGSRSANLFSNALSVLWKAWESCSQSVWKWSPSRPWKSFACLLNCSRVMPSLEQGAQGSYFLVRVSWCSGFMRRPSDGGFFTVGRRSFRRLYWLSELKVMCEQMGRSLQNSSSEYAGSRRGFRRGSIRWRGVLRVGRRMLSLVGIR